MTDYGSGLDLDRFHVEADFAIDGMPPGEQLAKRFKPVSPGVWELKLARADYEVQSRLAVCFGGGQAGKSDQDRTEVFGREIMAWTIHKTPRARTTNGGKNRRA